MKNDVPTVWRLMAGIVAMSFCVAAPAEASDNDTAAARSSGQNILQEVVVTATKRSERLQDVPITINVIGSQQIQQLGITSFADYASLVPNLVEANGATPGTGVVIMRGLYSGNTQTTATTATYIGDAPVTPSGSVSLSTNYNLDPDLLDVERIEVLAGPQGTLYGASSLGGLIRIIPVAPEPSGVFGDIRVDGDTVDGGGNGGGVHGTVNVPLSQTAALLVSGFERYDPGFASNLGTGHKDLGNTQAEGGSAAMRVNISPAWNAEVRGLYEYSWTRGLREQNDTAGTGTAPYGERTYNYPNDGGTVSQFWLASGATNYHFDAGTATGTISHEHSLTTLTSDGTDIYGPLDQLVQSALPVQVFPSNLSVLTKDSPLVDKTTVELRFASKRLESFEYLGGIFYTDENTNIPVLIQNESPAGVPLQLPGALSALDDVVDVTSLNNYREYAAYGDGTYYITDAIDITGGLRYSYNSQIVTDVSPPGGIINAGNFSLHFSDHSLIYQASARWRPSKNASVYFRVATGYRPGGPQPSGVTGPNVPPTYKPDKLVSYEVGAKGRALDSRFSYDLSLYHEEWKDIQLNSYVDGFTVFGNGGEAKIDGVEAQLEWTDPSGLRLGTALGFNNARLTAINAGTAIVLGANPGDRLPGSPKVTASAQVEYQRDFGRDLKGTVGAIERYQGDTVSSYPGDTTNISYVIPAYATLDLFTSLDWQRYTAEFRVTNLADKNGITGYRDQEIFPDTAPADAYLIRPRTFTLSLTARF